MGSLVWLAILTAVVAPAITWLILRSKATHPILWAAGGLAAHLVMGNLMNRVVLPAVSPMPTGVKRIPRDGEYMRGSLAEYRARLAWIRRNTAISMGFGLLSAAGLGLLGRLVGGDRRMARQIRTAPKQLVGQPCAVCQKRVVVAPDAQHCERCGAPLHRTCLRNHSCSP